ncbi:lipopolysaccharide heptosyltransferase II [Arenicella chitinivorans]|uniref:lipopolysaccharide heptosyltransferase II n=1 Tax=Arenicella chitinivorans TaxID=1329800 RepID=A0A918RL44_9GAMM|nr:lipopolysaccharide heptosyltransferase II [Arenicella chitinivorans]GHA03340.1 lipopolysaccharide heptosyltransferase II [Arenicella chitinivorans]
MSEQTKKYLIIGPAWVGDMVMAQSLFIDIKSREPDAQIDVLAPAWTAAMTDRMPQVGELIAGNFNHGKLSLGERIRLGKSLRDRGYSNAIVLPNSLKSALVPAVARIPQRTGWLGEQRWGLLNDIRRLDKQRWPMTVQRFIALGESKAAPVRAIDKVPPPLLEVDANAVLTVLQANQLDTEKPILVLCPGAEFGPSKQWPAAHYAAVAKAYLQLDWQVWLMGSDKDVLVCDEINGASGGQCHVLAGKTSLPEAVDLMSLASLVVSNDSGLMHIAAALQKPLVAVYGSTDPGHTPPLSHNHAIARLGLDCSPCFKRECPLEHLNCLTQLSPQRVIELSQTL